MNMGVSENSGTPIVGWFILMENPIKSIKMDDLGVPLFSETSIYRIATKNRGFIFQSLIFSTLLLLVSGFFF